LQLEAEQLRWIDGGQRHAALKLAQGSTMSPAAGSVAMFATGCWHSVYLLASTLKGHLPFMLGPSMG